MTKTCMIVSPFLILLKKFKNCDDDFVYQEVLKTSLMPFWATENYTSVTKIRSTISFESFKKYYLDFILSRFYNGKLSFGSLPQGYGGNRLCPNPCLNTKVYFSV